MQLRETTIPELLTLYHELSLTIKVETNPALLTTGETSKPAHRKYPKRIVPWDNFATRQQEIWATICASSIYSQRLFDPSAAIQRKTLTAVRSENELGANEGVAIQEPLVSVLEKFFEDEELRRYLQLPGKVTYVSHLNLDPGTQIGTTTASMENLSMSSAPITPDQSIKRAKGKAAVKGQQYQKDTGGQADKFCIVKLETGQERPAYSIEYKPPFKLTATEVVTGLQGEIRPARDVINQDGEGFEFHSKRLVSAVITQLFSYMIKTGVQYGYVSTGELIIFLHISDDPEEVQYHLCTPRLDVDLNDAACLHKTAVAEVIAFSLQALAAKPPPLGWHDDAAKLDTWEVEYVDILKNIPETIRKERETPLYKPSRSAALFARSPIALRLRVRPKDSGSKGNEDKDEKKDGFSNPPTQESGCRPQDRIKEESDDTNDEQGDGSPIRPPNRAKRSNAGKAGNRAKRDAKETAAGHGRDSRKRVHEREYCSQPCLLGLASGGLLDPHCPNIAEHGKKHLKRPVFLRLMREQMARDRGHVTDCEPLWIGGSRGAMFKITLTTHGYTVIAKGMQLHDVPHLQHEAKIYRQLRPIQGIHIPVCLGSIDLVLPYYHKGGEFVRLLYLSYAGVPVFRGINGGNKTGILSNISNAMEAIHRLRVLHCDPMPRNIMWDEKSGAVQIVDFERSKVQEQQKKMVKKVPLSARSANRRTIHPSAASDLKKAKTETWQNPVEVKDDDFAREQRIALAYTADCVR